MKSALLEVLEGFGLPVVLQGSLVGEYPERFFTFWNNETYDIRKYDNASQATVWDFDVNFYSTDPTDVNEMLAGPVKDALKAAGFYIDGKGHDIGSDEPTHTGRGLHVLGIEKVT